MLDVPDADDLALELGYPLDERPPSPVSRGRNGCCMSSMIRAKYAHIKKRLRKKLRKGEFREFGFDLRFAINPDLTDAAQNELFDAFLVEAIESNDLAFGGGGRHGSWDGFVTRVTRGGASAEVQERVRQWLQQHPEIDGIEVGPLVDAWYR